MRPHTLTHALADFAHTKAVPEPSLEGMRLSLLDWMSCAIAAKNEPVAEAVRAFALHEGGRADSSIIGAPVKLPARLAALVNGTIGHALDYDDTHFAHIGHPSAVICPATLALAQSTGATARDMVEAMLVGVEASIRVGLWLGRAHYAVGYHQTATAGAFGAGIAAARLLGLCRAQTEAVIGLMATRASGLKVQFGSMGKPYNAGIAASNGVEVALLVKHGLLPNARGLDGDQDFGFTHHGEANLDAALAGMGTVWLFDEVSHKFHACCHGLHAALESLRPMRGKADQIQSIVVETNPRWLTVCNKDAPVDGLECKFSYKHVLALAANGLDTGDIKTFTDNGAHDPILVAFRDRISVRENPNVPETASRVTVTLTAGATQTLSADLTAPITISEKRQRLVHKSSSLVGGDTCMQIASMIENEAAPDDLAAILAH